MGEFYLFQLSFLCLISNSCIFNNRLISNIHHYFKCFNFIFVYIKAVQIQSTEFLREGAGKSLCNLLACEVSKWLKRVSEWSEGGGGCTKYYI